MERRRLGRLGHMTGVIIYGVFLSTKTGEGAAGPAYDQIRGSLERLQVEGVPDLEPPFRRNAGRVVPDWLEPLLES